MNETRARIPRVFVCPMLSSHVAVVHTELQEHVTASIEIAIAEYVHGYLYGSSSLEPA